MLACSALLFVSQSPLPAAEPSPSRIILTNLSTAPFPHPSRTNGHTYQGKHYPAETHYADSRVLIAVPSGLPAGPSVDVVVHFHGWHNKVTNALHQFRLLEQLQASRRPAVLVMPEGPRDAPDSSGGRLEEPDGFRRFMDDVLRVIRAELSPRIKLGNITLSGHSGGYRVIGWILHHGGLGNGIREVFLFDAIYAQTEHFRAWAGKPEHRLVAIYTDGGGTLSETRRLMAQLKADGIPFRAAEDPGTTREQLVQNRVVFLHTDLGHNEVIAARRHFEWFLTLPRLLPDPAPAAK